MSAGPRIPYVVAAATALVVRGLIADLCHQVHVAGSLRRQRSAGIRGTVGDVELVALPLDGPERYWARIDQLGWGPYQGTGKNGRPQKRWGQLQRRIAVPAQGPAARPGQVVPVEIITASWDNLGYKLAVHTGPAEFSHNLVKGRQYGGLRPDWVELKGGLVYSHGRQVVVPTEQDLFSIMGLAWLEPHERDEWKRALAGPDWEDLEAEYRQIERLAMQTSDEERLVEYAQTT